MIASAQGTALLFDLARRYFDVADALNELRVAMNAHRTPRGANAARVEAAYARLEVLVPPRPPRWALESPRYSRVDATIVSRTITSQAVALLFRRLGSMRFDPREHDLHRRRGRRRLADARKAVATS